MESKRHNTYDHMRKKRKQQKASIADERIITTNN